MMRGKVTSKQNNILKSIYKNIKEDGHPPSFEELRKIHKVTSNQTILDHLDALEKKRLITREHKSARGISITQSGFKALGVTSLVPMAGSSYAGSFTETFELSGGWIELSKEVKQLSNEVFVIEVSGDSMINAGIHSGDKLLIQRQDQFSSGDIVLAQSPDGTTIKRFIRQNKPPFISLKAENPNFSDILFSEDVEMMGKAVGKLVSNHWQQLVQGKFI